MYTVQALAELSGVSPRTLRYYDQIGLLIPRRQDASGYRIYGPEDVARLQQILLYRRLELPLEEIRSILDAADFDPAQALQGHKEALQARQAQLTRLLRSVEKTLDALKGEKEMKDAERFEGLKDDMISENEKKYGQEVRQRWGDQAADEANRRIKGMSQEQYETLTQLEHEIKDTLGQALNAGDPAAPLARRTVELHHQWLSAFGQYPPEAHQGLGEMYVEDPRFAAYYDAVAPGAAVFLRDAIRCYYENQQ